MGLMIYEHLVAEIVNSQPFQFYLEKAANAAQIPDNDTPKDPTIGCCVAIIGTISFAIFVATRKNKLPEGYKSSRQESYTPSWEKRPSSEYRVVPTSEGLGLIKKAIAGAWNSYDAYLNRNATTAIHDQREAKLEKLQARRNLQIAIEQEFAELIAGQKSPQYYAQHFEHGEQYDNQTRRAALKAKDRVLKEVLGQFDDSPLLPLYGYKSSQAFEEGLSVLHQLANLPRRERKKRDNDREDVVDGNLYD